MPSCCGSTEMTDAAPAWRQTWLAFLVLWDRASIYLPVVLMSGLALATYWLVRNAPVFSVVETVKQKVHEPDYQMRNFTMRSFGANGLLKSEIYGTQARHYPDTDTLEVDQARIRSIDANGRLTTSSANLMLSNADGSELQLIGNALVVREASRDASGKETPRVQYSGEFLHAFMNEDRVNSHKPVALTRGADQFTGDSFAYDNLTGVAVLKGRVKGQLVPKAP